MENIKFIKRIASYCDRGYKIIGNCVYFTLNNGNVAKAYCEEMGVCIDMVNKTEGKVDCIKLPFANYFKPTQCSPGAPKWTQHIENGKWWFEAMYKHVLPTIDDYCRLAEAIDDYLEMFN